MTSFSKRQKTGKKKILIINAFSNGSAGNWTNPKDRSAELGNSIDAWIEFAQLAERGKLNSIFVADHLGLFDVYDGPNNYKHPARIGLNVARIEPGTVVTALATHTKTIGFGITFSTISEHPYLFSRRLASLDNLSKGRIGWNIVSSYLPSAGRQLLSGKLPPHDQRYTRTSEYLEVVYKLLLSSWRDDALVKDRKNQIFVNPERIREINHKGKFFDVPGPAIFENTPQRFPVIIQAGSSEKGILFAAENAEVVFVDSTDPTKLRNKINSIKKIASEQFLRNPDHIKFLVPGNVIIGRTHEEALEKYEEYKKYKREDYTAITFSSISGIDLSKYEDDQIVSTKNKSEGIRSTTDGALNRNNKQNTKKEILTNLDNLGMYGSPFVGSVEEVADEIEKWIEDYDIDGFNFGLGGVWPSNLEDIVDLLIPELQKRGLFWDDYPVPGGTFRENLYGKKDHKFLAEDHPAYKLRWREGVSKELFEESLSK